MSFGQSQVSLTWSSGKVEKVMTFASSPLLGGAPDPCPPSPHHHKALCPQEAYSVMGGRRDVN